MHCTIAPRLPEIFSQRHRIEREYLVKGHSCLVREHRLARGSDQYVNF